jgi:hypothetical protein
VNMTAYGLRWQSLVDFVVLALSIYLLLRWSRDARALRVALGILALEAGALVAGSSIWRSPSGFFMRRRSPPASC